METIEIWLEFRSVHRLWGKIYFHIINKLSFQNLARNEPKKKKTRRSGVQAIISQPGLIQDHPRRSQKRDRNSGSNEAETDPIDHEFESNEDESDDDWMPPTRNESVSLMKRLRELPFLESYKQGWAKHISPEVVRKSLILLLRTNVAACQIPTIFEVIFFDHFFQ